MTSALARKYKLDVAAYSSALTVPSAYTTVFGINDFSDNVTPTLPDVSDYDTNGWASYEKTLQAWTATAKMRRPIVAGAYDTGQEILRAAKLGTGDNARVFARYYDRNGGPEAYAGVALVTWARTKTAVTDIEEITVTLTGTDFALAPISNPYSVTNGPVITAVTPSAQNSGKAIAISGSGFTAATAVTIGGTAATSFVVVNDQLVIAVLPTASAGSAPVIVTTGIGSATAFAYTRGA